MTRVLVRRPVTSQQAPEGFDGGGDGYDYDSEYAAQVEAAAYAQIKAESIRTHGPLPTFEQVAADAETYAREFLWVKPRTGMPVPFRYNTPQLKARDIKRKALKAGRPARFIYLKARREGVTTYEQSETFHACVFNPFFSACTLAHTDKDAVKIFRAVELFYSMLPEAMQPVRPPAGNKREMSFPALRSVFEIGTAGSRGFARGSTYNKIHWSEVAHSPGDPESQELLLSGITEAASDGEVVLESTANGAGDFFHATWEDAGKPGSEFTQIFLAWFDDPRNRYVLTPNAKRQVASSYTEEEFKLVRAHKLTPEQIAWRRAMKRRLKVFAMQEYPETAEQAFMSAGLCFFNTQVIANLLLELPDYSDRVEHLPGGFYVEWKAPQQGHEYVLGADTSEGVPGGDPNGFGILDRATGEQVAAAHGHFSPRELARLIARAHKRYSFAGEGELLLGVERNNHGHAVIQKLTDLGLGEPHFQGGPLFWYAPGKDYGSARAGFDTNLQTRPLILDNLSEGIETAALIVRDRDMLKECLGFKKQSSGRFEGKPDDRVMKWAIAREMLQHRVMKPDIGEVTLETLGG